MWRWWRWSGMWRWWRSRPRRCGGRRRRVWRRRSLRRLLGLSIGTQLLLGLRDDQRRGLRVRWSSGQLQRGESCGGKQQESKFCHDGGVPGKILATRFGNMVCQQTLTINEQALGWIVASFKPELVFISGTAKSECALVHCAFRPSFQIVALHFALAAIRSTLARSPLRSRYFRCPSRVRGCSVPAARAPAIPPACGLATPLAVMARRVPAWAVAPRGEGFRVGSPAAAPTAARA